MVKSCFRGFTLAELLIALAILGMIAAFSIPKLLSSQQQGSSEAKAKETAAMLSAAFQLYRLNQSLSSETTAGAFTQYMNYVTVAGSGQMDDIPGRNIAFDCGYSICLKLHNGGMLFTDPDAKFDGTGTTNAVYFFFDPDGVRGTSGMADAPGKSVAFWIYYGGRITSSANVMPNTSYYNGGGGSQTTNPGDNADPAWFSW